MKSIHQAQSGSGIHQMPRRKHSTLFSMLFGLTLLAGSSLAAAQSPTVDGSFYCSGDSQYYTLYNLSYLGSPLYITIVDSTLYVALVTDSTAVNENTYDCGPGQGGCGGGGSDYMDSAGWGSHRSLLRNIDSEYAEFYLEIGDESWAWRQGYGGQIDTSGTIYTNMDVNNTNAGGRIWISDHRVSGGSLENTNETPTNPGELPPGLVSSSSIAWNMNRYAENLANNDQRWDMNVHGNNARAWKSPFLESNPDDVTLVDGYPTTGQSTCSTQFDWEWAMVYEFSVDLSQFGPSPIFVLNGNSHHSPLKGTQSELCPGEGDDCFPDPEDPILTDYGDLPEPYPTLSQDDGARHTIFSNSAYLGLNAPDPEPNGQPHPAALGDDLSGIDDEDGVRIMTPEWVAGETATFEVIIGREGHLSAFIDFNGNGTLTQANAVSISGPASVSTGPLGDTLFPEPGVYEVEVDLPSDTIDVLATRWRITNEAGQGGNSVIGRAESGEVEDHMFQRMEAIDVIAQCGTGANNNPVSLAAQINGVSEVEFFYWQNGVSTQWTSADAWDETTNPVTVPLADDSELGIDFELIDDFDGFEDDGFFNIWYMEWNTLDFDLSAGQTFQIRVEGRDEFGNVVADTLLEYNVAMCDSTGVPVTLSSFESSVRGNHLVIDWATSSEIANAGFNLYGETADGDWIELTDEMVPSEVVDSADPQFYSAIVSARGIERLFLEDVDVFGVTELHGPFEVSAAYGNRPEVIAIDWEDVRRQPNMDRTSTRGRSWRQQDRDPIRLLISESGVYRFSHEELLDAGMDLNGVPVNQIALTNQGQNVPLHTEARGRFGPGDFIEFYARPFDSLYTDTNVYVLEIANPSGRRMDRAVSPGQTRSPGRGGPVQGIVDSYIESVWVGEERQYLASSYIESPWFDTRMQVTGSPREYKFNLVIDGRVGSEVVLAPDYWGYTTVSNVDPDHHVQIYFNGELVHDDWFNGRVRRQPEIVIPDQWVQDGVNQVVFRLPADTGASVDGVALTGFEVRFERELRARDGSLEFTAAGSNFRVAGLTTPEPVVYRVDSEDVTRIDRLQASESGDGSYSVEFAGGQSEATYVVADPNDLPVPSMEPGHSPVDITSGRADYLMIAHPAFIDGLQPLVAFHQSRGRDVRVVDVNDIYDQFSHGIVDARAIQDYVRATAGSMGYRYVLLVGGDTFDYKDNLGLGSVSFIPSLYTHTDDRVRFAPADALYVDLDGNDAPDLAIGRLPVRTTGELAEIIQKTFEYVDRSYRGVAVLATDHAEPGVSYRNHLESLVDQGLSTWYIRRAHLDDLSVADARDELISGINSGASLTAFLGHSAHTVWTFSGLFRSSDVANLTNFGKPTAVAQWGCWNTYHVGPLYQTLGHRFMLTPDRGAALVMGSSTFSHVHSGQLLGNRLIPLLANGQMSAGQALSTAQRDLAKTNPHARDAILGWTILGDPTLVIGD